MGTRRLGKKVAWHLVVLPYSSLLLRQFPRSMRDRGKLPVQMHKPSKIRVITRANGGSCGVLSGEASLLTALGRPALHSSISAADGVALRLLPHSGG
eukprot:1492216-Amphidinium_carterae.1